MDNKRKDELGSLFVFNNKYSNKEFEKVTIQELVFLIYTIRVFKEKEILKNYDYDTKIITFTKVLINKIKLTKKLYIAYGYFQKKSLLIKQKNILIKKKHSYR